MSNVTEKKPNQARCAMFPDIEVLRQKAAHDKDLLRAVEAKTFPAGETVWGGHPGLPVLIQPELYRGRPNLHMIAIGVHPPVRPVLRRLACGVLDGSGQIAAAGRTDANGVLWVDLPPGEYHLRLICVSSSLALLKLRPF